jgi:hypothetical protein
MVDISTPLNPVYAGCFSSDGYTHDAECIIYNGPDHESEYEFGGLRVTSRLEIAVW